jgi:hypothetical protein
MAYVASLAAAVGLQRTRLERRRVPHWPERGRRRLRRRELRRREATAPTPLAARARAARAAAAPAPPWSAARAAPSSSTRPPPGSPAAARPPGAASTGRPPLARRRRARGLTYRRGCDDAVDCPGQRCFADMFAERAVSPLLHRRVRRSLPTRSGYARAPATAKAARRAVPVPAPVASSGSTARARPRPASDPPLCSLARHGLLAGRSLPAATTEDREHAAPTGLEALMPGLARSRASPGGCCSALRRVAGPAAAAALGSTGAGPTSRRASSPRAPPLAETAPFELVSATPEGELAALAAGHHARVLPPGAADRGFAGEPGTWRASPPRAAPSSRGAGSGTAPGRPPSSSGSARLGQ